LHLVPRLFYQKHTGLGPAFLQFRGICGEHCGRLTAVKACVTFAIPPLLTETGVRRVQQEFFSRGRILMSLLRSTLFIATASLLAFRCHAQITVVKPVPARATIAVDAGKTAGAPIPRTIFGSFLEPIGNSTYNGLWAELLVNPSLERKPVERKESRNARARSPGANGIVRARSAFAVGTLRYEAGQPL
jgi:hypothetical protein